MSENEKTYTLADVRAAYAKGAHNSGVPMSAASELARNIYPDPEPERRWVKDGGSGDEVTRTPDGKWLWRRPGSADVLKLGVDDDAVRARFSLLPRVPVTVTCGMLDKAVERFRSKYDYADGIRAALEAVAADLAQPATTCQHKATRWILRTNTNRELGPYREREKAENAAYYWDGSEPSNAPHRVVALAEVEQG